MHSQSIFNVLAVERTLKNPEETHEDTERTCEDTNVNFEAMVISCITGVSMQTSMLDLMSIQYKTLQYFYVL